MNSGGYFAFLIFNELNMSRVSPTFVILGLLETESSHGYQLLEHFRDPEQLGLIWKLSTSRVYAILKQLENDELIDGREEEAVDAPMRTVYWLTDKGRKLLHQWLNDPTPSASTRNIRTEFLSRLYIAHLLNTPHRPIIDAQRETCQSKLSSLQQEFEKQVSSMSSMALALQVKEMQSIIDWLDTCENIFQGRPVNKT